MDSMLLNFSQKKRIYFWQLVEHELATCTVKTENADKCRTDEITPCFHKRTALQGLNRYYSELVTSAKTLIVKVAFCICIRNNKSGP